MDQYSLRTVNKKKQAAETSLERIRRSIEGALEKEKQCVEKEALNQYIRDASLRMSLNLPIKPTKSHLKEDQDTDHKKTLKPRSDYKLPSLQHGDVSPTKRSEPRMLNAEKAARPNTANTSMSIDTFPSGSNKPNIRLPPIIIDTGQQEKVGKRKRKKDESTCSDIKGKKKTSPERFTSKPAKSRLESVSPSEEDFNVVMCGRSPKANEAVKELFVSKHGRFKSK
jgi:hypothetical protein